MRYMDEFNPAVTGIGDPHRDRRDYDLRAGAPLAGLLDNPWYPPYIRDTAHSHNCMEIGVCLSGCGSVSINRSTWRFSEGTVLAVPKGVPHAQQNEGDPMTHWRYVLVNVSAYLNEAPSRLRPAAERGLRRIRSGVCIGPEQASRGIRATIEAMFRLRGQRRPPDDIEMDALLCLLMAQIASVPDEAPDDIGVPPEARGIIEPALQYVSENYTQEIRVADMAASCAMSESYFRKVFARAAGMPPLEYVNRYRINRSIYLLHATNETVMTIASMSGFPSIATYNRNFMKYVGVSPARWRKNEQV